MLCRSPIAVVVAAAAVLVHTQTADAQCEPRWATQAFTGPAPGGLNAAAAFDDGTGPAVYFGTAETAELGPVVRLEGANWKDVGGPLLGTARALASFDADETDGEQPVLIAAGQLSMGGGSVVARWDGATWTGLGGHDGEVTAVAVVPEGPGRNALYIGGSFTTIGGVAAARVAKWRDGQWQPLASGTNGAVRALLAARDGAGGTLIAGGSFTEAGSEPANHIAVWNGQTWAPLGAGMDGAVDALAEFDSGSGPTIYAGGVFGHAGGVPADRVARWTGEAWEPVGGPLPGPAGWPVRALAVHDGGRGPALYAGGPQRLILRLESGTWKTIDPLTPWTGPVRTMISFDTDGVGPNPPELYMGLEGQSDPWQPTALVLSDTGLSIPGRAYEGLVGSPAQMWTLGSGPSERLLAHGRFRHARTGSDAVGARWDPSGWVAAAGAGHGGSQIDLVEVDGGEGPALHGVGAITGSGPGGAVFGAARRTLAGDWVGLGDGLGLAQDATQRAYAAAVFDDGSGAALYAGGTFLMSGQAPVPRIGRWDGVQWSPVGGGLDNGIINDLLVCDPDGAGPEGEALFIGGEFLGIGGVPALNIGRWDGAAWRPVSVTPGSYPQPRPAVLAAIDDAYPGAPARALYAGGRTGYPGSESSHPGVARWTGTSWALVGPQLDRLSVTAGTAVRTLAGFDAGDGPRLYAAGSFTGLPDRAPPYIASWNAGTQWEPVGGGVDGPVDCLRVFDDDGAGPNPPMLHVGGSFGEAGGRPSGGFARWGPPIPGIAAQPQDRRTPAGRAVGFSVRAEAPGDVVSYQWRRDGVPLADDGRISGAATPSLVVRAITAEDAGVYDAVLTGVCAAAHSVGARLTVVCPADWDGDGAVNSRDVSAYLAAWLACLAGGSLGADFDGNGAVNSVDIQAFLGAWLAAVGGGC